MEQLIFQHQLFKKGSVLKSNLRKKIRNNIIYIIDLNIYISYYKTAFILMSLELSFLDSYPERTRPNLLVFRFCIWWIAQNSQMRPQWIVIRQIHFVLITCATNKSPSILKYGSSTWVTHEGVGHFFLIVLVVGVDLHVAL